MMKDVSLQTALVLSYFVGINVITFFLYGLDKWKAKTHRQRIPEPRLLMLAVVGGSIEAWAGMKVWHHKTLHRKFRYGVPLVMIVQIVLLLLILIRNLTYDQFMLFHYDFKRNASGGDFDDNAVGGKSGIFGVKTYGKSIVAVYEFALLLISHRLYM